MTDAIAGFEWDLDRPQAASHLNLSKAMNHEVEALAGLDRPAAPRQKWAGESARPQAEIVVGETPATCSLTEPCVQRVPPVRVGETTT